MLPCLVFLTFPAFAEEPPSFCERTEAEKALCASAEIAPFLDCPTDAPCEALRPGAGGAERVEIVTPEDAPEGYAERIYIVE